MKARLSRALYKASETEKKRYEKEQLKEIKAALRRPLTTDRSDWTEHARQAEEIQRARDLLVRLRSKYAEADQLLAEVRDRYRATLDAAYPPGFWEHYRCLKAGDPAGLETAVRFLEADPWFFRTGYEKADLIKWLTRMELTEKDMARLRQVVLNAVDSRDRREFRAYCRLARRVDHDRLRQALAERLNSEDEGVRRRARWVLDALGAF